MAADLKASTDLKTELDGSGQRLLTAPAEQRLLPDAKEKPPEASKSHWRLVALVLAALVCYGGYRWFEKKKADEAAAAAKKKAQPPPRVPVVAVAARKMDMPVYLTGLGSVTAYNTVTVKTRVDGQIV